MYFPKNFPKLIFQSGLESCKKCAYYRKEDSKELCSKFIFRNRVKKQKELLTIEESREYSEFCGKYGKYFTEFR